MRVLEHHQRSQDVSQFLVSTRPETPPAQIVRSIKGRLQYLLRAAMPKAFHRNYFIGSVGSADRAAVQAYVETQLSHHSFPDASMQARLARYQICRKDLDLSRRQHSAHAEFIYNLHLVFVHEQRWTQMDLDALAAIHSMIQAASRKSRHRLSRAAILPDHVHLLVGCNVTESPVDVALSYLNNLVYAQGMRRVYQYGFYEGTVGDYDLGAIRASLA